MFLKIAQIQPTCLYTTVIQNQQHKNENLPDNSRNNFRVTSIDFTATRQSTLLEMIQTELVQGM